jgi:hypothetical protein
VGIAVVGADDLAGSMSSFVIAKVTAALATHLAALP